jgi:hypothetical protein
MERQSADLSTATGSCRRYDSRRPAQRRRSVAVGAQCRGRISGQSPHRAQGLPATGRRRAGRDQARSRHVRECWSARSLAQGGTAEVSYRSMARNRRDDSAARDHTERVAQSGNSEVRDQRSEVRWESRAQEEWRFTQLSTTASILTLTGLASWREPSAIQGREKFFTLRREDAKEATESKHRISSRNLSGFASLRETSATQGRGKFFTLRRQGAKEPVKSKSPVSSLDLSGFAPSREISGFCRQRRRQLQRRKEKGGALRPWQR